MKKAELENRGAHVFCSQISNKKDKSQLLSVVSYLKDEPNFGDCILIEFPTSGGNYVTVFITLEQLAEWIVKGIPKPPGELIPPFRLLDQEDLSIDFSDLYSDQ